MATYSNTNKKDVYEAITEQLIQQIEQGVCPWLSPYLATVGFPKNYATKNSYRGINVFLLGMAGFSSPWFLTFVQAKAQGGNVKRGEKGSFVVKYGTYETENESGEEQKRGFLKSYTVFNSSQIEGIEFPSVELRSPVTDTCAEARKIVAGMPNRPTIKYGSAMAFYRPADDVVSMPNMEDMRSPASYYSTLHHEIVHACGAAHRLNRKSLVENRGMHASRKVYAEEELVAEMGAAFLNATAGILESEVENSAAYLAGWLKALKTPDAKNWIIRAASQAQKSVDYILNVTRE
ncbi:MAG: zincin-like metallopeptidase domain-containing protein [Verrucomicrobiota bacterium]